MACATHSGMVMVGLVFALLALQISSAHTDIQTPPTEEPRVETWTWAVKYGMLTSPVVSEAAGALYVMSKLGTLWAISLSTGKPIWRFRSYIVFPSNQVAQPLVSAALPLSADGCTDTVFIGGMHALNACSGAVQWRAPVLGSNYSSPSAASFRSTQGTPLTMLFVNTKAPYGLSYLRFVHAATGEVALSRQLLGTKASPPVVSVSLALPGGLVCICTAPDLAHKGAFDTPEKKDGVLYAFGANSGKLLWSWRGATHSTAFLSSPAIFPGSAALPEVRVFVAHQNPQDEYGISALNASSGAC